MRRIVALAAACAAVLALLPGAATAATAVSLTEHVQVYDKYTSVFATLAIRGDDGTNLIGYTRERDSVTVRDPAGVQPGPGCFALEGEAGTAARCPVRFLASVGGRADGAAGDDLLALAGLFTGVGTADGGPGDDVVEADGTLAGGPGADILRGGEIGDLLDGGPGPDVLEGGPSGGPDYADYRSRTAGVRVDLAGDAGAGEAGEGDRLTGIEGVLGGAGDDVLTGSAGDNDLDGGAGDDQLSGGDGADYLKDGQGGAVLDGGAGDDSLSTGTDIPARRPAAVPAATVPAPVPAGRGTLLGGPGRDTLLSGSGADRLDPGSDEDVVIAGGGGPADAVALRDGGFDTVTCGLRSRVRSDAQDLARGCRRVARSGPARPWLVSVGGAGAARNEGKAGFTVIACADPRRRCRGHLRVDVDGRPAGARRFSVRPADSKVLKVALAARVAREVRRRGSVRATFTLAGRDAAGRAVRQRRTMRFCTAGSAGCPD